MVVRKKTLHQLIEQLESSDQKTAHDFLLYLIDRSKKKPMAWAEIEKNTPDDNPLTEDELRQLKSEEGYLTGRKAKHEYGLQVDLP